MIEILRMLHAATNQEYEENMVDYNLAVHEGEIVYIQGIEESGINALLSFFQGKIPLCKGTLRMKNSFHAVTITSEESLIPNMTVADNLEAIRKIRFPYKVYSKKEVAETTRKFLEQEQIKIRAEAKVEELSKMDRDKICLIKAKMHRAGLIVIDVSRKEYAGAEGVEFCKYMCKLAKEGIAFIILSESYNAICNYASRIQFMSNGRDLMEWWGSAKEEQYRCMHPIQKQKKENAAGEPEIEGLIAIADAEWNRGAEAYMTHLKIRNCKMWNELIDINDKVVYISGRSEKNLVDSLSIGDNLIFYIPGRISNWKYGWIRDKYKKKLLKECRDTLEIGEEISQVKQLSKVEKRILSIHAFEVTRPDVIVLESPFLGFNTKEIERMYRYIKHLTQKIRVICFTKKTFELEECCSTLITSDGGRHITWSKKSEIATKGQIIPPE